MLLKGKDAIEDNLNICNKLELAGISLFHIHVHVGVYQQLIYQNRLSTKFA